MVKKVVKTAVLLVWLCLIYSLSSQTGTVSGGLSFSILKNIATVINNFIKIDIDQFAIMFHYFFRKMAHFSEYFVLFILSFSCFKEYKSDIKEKNVLIFCLLYAVLDEGHQLFVSGRAGQLGDVMIDLMGSLLALMLWHQMSLKWKK